MFWLIKVRAKLLDAKSNIALNLRTAKESVTETGSIHKQNSLKNVTVIILKVITSSHRIKIPATKYHNNLKRQRSYLPEHVIINSLESEGKEPIAWHESELMFNLFEFSSSDGDADVKQDFEWVENTPLVTVLSFAFWIFEQLPWVIKSTNGGEIDPVLEEGWFLGWRNLLRPAKSCKFNNSSSSCSFWRNLTIKSCNKSFFFFKFFFRIYLLFFLVAYEFN